MKRILFLLAMVLIISGCNTKSRFTIEGTIKNPKQKYVSLSRLELDTPVFIDSVKISSKGSFHFKVKASDTEFYQLGTSKNNYITLLAEPGENIKVAFSSADLFRNYTISGSEGSAKLQSLDITLAETKNRLDSLNLIYARVSAEAGSDTKVAQIQEEINNIIKAQRKKNIEFIITNINSLASIKALYQRFNKDTYVLYDPHDLQYLKIVTDSLTKHYPNSKQVKALALDFEKEMKQMQANIIDQLAKNVPQITLNPDLKTINGNRVALSSLKGKYVLLTFWSFKSPDCVAENLELKELYSVYHKKGFEIYSINLDENEDAWKKAVNYDELPWINTREDDPADPKNAVLYNVKSVPANYLYNKENVIIASNIHGRALKLKLNQLFNQ